MEDQLDLITVRQPFDEEDPQDDMVIKLLNSQRENSTSQAALVAKFHKKVKFYEQIQLMIEAKLQQDRNNFFNAQSKERLMKSQRLTSQEGQICQSIKTYSMKILELVVNKEQYEQAASRLQKELADYQVNKLQRQQYQDFLKKTNKKTSDFRKSNQASKRQVTLKAFEKVICNLNQLIENCDSQEKNFKLGSSHTPNSKQSDSSRKTFENKVKKLDELRIRIAQLNLKIGSLKRQQQSSQVRLRQIGEQRKSIEEYLGKMQHLEHQLIKLSLNHSKVIKKKRRAQQRLQEAKRGLQGSTELSLNGLTIRQF